MAGPPDRHHQVCGQEDPRHPAAAVELPQVRNAVEKGEISSDQAEAISRAAEKAPDKQAHLLDTAKHEPLTELRKECDRIIATSDDDFDARQERIRKQRSVTTFKNADGSKTLRATGTTKTSRRSNHASAGRIPSIQKQLKEVRRHRRRLRSGIIRRADAHHRPRTRQPVATMTRHATVAANPRSCTGPPVTCCSTCPTQPQFAARSYPASSANSTAEPCGFLQVSTAPKLAALGLPRERQWTSQPTRS